MMANKSTYTDRFGPFRGVDFSSDPKDVAPYRFSYSENMWRNYNRDGGSAIETIPGFRLVHRFGAPIHGIHSFQAMEKGDAIDYILVHAGTEIYYAKLDERDGGPYKKLEYKKSETVVDHPIGDHRSRSVQHNNRLYLLDGEKMWVIKDVEEGGVRGLEIKAITDSAYLPTTHINGQAFEQRNMVCNKAKETFLFPETETDLESWISGNAINRYDIYFNNPPDLNINGSDFDIKANGETVSQGEIPENAAAVTQTLADGESLFDFQSFDDSNINAQDARMDLIRNGARYAIRVKWNKPLPTDPTKKTVTLRIQVATVPNVVGSIIYLPALPYGSARGRNAGADMETECLGLRYYITGISANGQPVDITDFKQKFALEDKEAYDGSAGMRIGHGAAVEYTITGREGIDHYAVFLAMEIGQAGFSRTLYAFSWRPAPPTHLQYQWILDNEKIVGFSIGHGGWQTSLAGQTLEYTYPVDIMKFGTASTEGDFAQGNPSYNGTTVDAINQCTICAAYDGRIFLTGNPALPNTVFYCQRDNTGAVNASYWGTFNYFNEGVGGSSNVSLLPTADALLVFKGTTVQDGAVYARQGVNQDDDLMPRVYVGSSGVAGIGCLGAAINFYDDPVFLSSRGLDSIRKQAINLERSVSHRSSNVDTKMLQEDLSNARMVEWRGYLLLFFPSGHVYMADSRALFNHQHGSVEYEWFYLSGIGEYPNAARKYVYADHNYAGVGYEIADEERWNHPTLVPPLWASSSEGTFPYVAEGGKNLLVVSDGSFRTDKLTEDGNGYKPDAFSGASEALAVGDVLFFGTPAGGLFCFNNDLEGEALWGASKLAGSAAPRYLYAAGRMLKKDNTLSVDSGNGVVFEQIREGIPGVLHRQHYHFDGQPIVSGCITAASDAGIPYMTKTTIPRTAVCVYKAMPGARFSVLVSMDDGQFEEEQVVDMSNLDLDDFDFGSVAFTGSSSSSIAIRTHEKRWVHKKHQFYSNEYLRPFGIYSMSYAATVAGRIKNR